MEEDDFNISNYLQFKAGEDLEKFFTRERILKLLELYKKYKPKVGSYEVKTMKKLWELIARDLSNEYHITVAASKCENKFKVLERNYKKTIDHNNQTGRDPRVCEFQNELEEILGKRLNIKPKILLTSNTEISRRPSSNLQQSDILEKPETVVQISISEENPGNTDMTTPLTQEPLDSALTPVRTCRKRRKTATPAYKKRNEILLEIKNDLKSFYEKKTEMENKKLELAEKKREDREKRTEILKDYLEFMKDKTG